MKFIVTFIDDNDNGSLQSLEVPDPKYFKPPIESYSDNSSDSSRRDEDSYDDDDDEIEDLSDNQSEETYESVSENDIEEES